MAPYDSDSSGGEDNEYTETSVLLGYASKEPTDNDTISHLGGRPTWLDPSIPPSATLAKCKVCNDLMVLLLQLNGDLPEVFAGHERRLYVLSCRRRTCRRKEGSVRVLRGVRISEAAREKRKGNSKTEPKGDAQLAMPAVNIGEALFGTKPATSSSSTNPFSTSTSDSANTNPFSTSSSLAPSNPFATLKQPLSDVPPKSSQIPSQAVDLPKTFASALSLNTETPKFTPNPPEPWPETSSLPQAYPLYYVADADYEILDKVEDVPIPTQTMDLDEGPGSGGSQKEDKDVYESTIDKTFQKFADRLAQNPEQVIRYEFKGQPLLYSKHDAVGKLLGDSAKEQNLKVATSSGSGNRIPRCGNCGAGRVFEVQLTPYTIVELEREEVGIDGMEWGTIIVGVCERDCQQKGLNGNVGYVEEWAGVQWEELSERK